MKYYANGIEWEFEVQSDGWIGIYQLDRGVRIPFIQAKDYEHARSFCNMYERITVPFGVLCDDEKCSGNILCLFGGD